MARAWERLNEVCNPPSVVQQLHEYGCGAACAEMLLRDRGIEVDQFVVAEALRLPCTGGELARRLNELSAGRMNWIGGELDMDPPREIADLLPIAKTGTWAAMLIRAGTRHGHWVVVDAVGEDTVLIRDPAGSRYEIRVNEFLLLMRFMVVVFELGGIHADHHH